MAWHGTRVRVRVRAQDSVMSEYHVERDVGSTCSKPPLLVSPPFDRCRLVYNLVHVSDSIYLSCFPRSSTMPTDNQGHNSLPSYSSLATNSRSASGSRSARNSSSYSRPSRAPVEHLYTLTDNSNRAYATLRLSSYAASSRFLPSYYDGETISGSMELSYPKPETVVSVTVVVSHMHFVTLAAEV